MSIREIAQNFRNFCTNIYLPCFPSFLIAFAQIFPLLLPEFPTAFARIAKAILLLPEISGKSNGKFRQKQWKFGQKQWENFGKSNEKTRKAAAYISGKTYSFCPNFPLLFPEIPTALARIVYYFFPNFPIAFCPNFPLLLPEFPTAFARIFRFQIFLGGTVPPLPPPIPPPPASYAYDQWYFNNITDIGRFGPSSLSYFDVHNFCFYTLFVYVFYMNRK